MSEYQWVEFRAVDAPLDGASLAFMRKQSTRAEIDEWRFTNEYHFGDFRGDVTEMMRRGFDVHVHYANFGIRRICFHIPDGFAYSELLDRVAAAGHHSALGGIALPNPASVALHEKLGFTKVGHLKEVGRKFDQWIDVGYWQKILD